MCPNRISVQYQAAINANDDAILSMFIMDTI